MVTFEEIVEILYLRNYNSQKNNTVVSETLPKGSSRTKSGRNSKPSDVLNL